MQGGGRIGLQLQELHRNVLNCNPTQGFPSPVKATTQREQPRLLRRTMAQLQTENMQKIRAYAREVRELQDVHMDFDASGTEARLDQTLSDLQARVLEQQAALEKVSMHVANCAAPF